MLPLGKPITRTKQLTCPSQYPCWESCNSTQNIGRCWQCTAHSVQPASVSALEQAAICSAGLGLHMVWSLLVTAASHIFCLSSERASERASSRSSSVAIQALTIPSHFAKLTEAGSDSFSRQNPGLRVCARPNRRPNVPVGLMCRGALGCSPHNF